MLDLIIAYPPLFLTGVFGFGLLIGSFLNVVILRLPARLEYDWRCQCKELLEIEHTSEAGETAKPPLSIIWSRSQCPKCGHNIKGHENIPLLSYLFLRGRCASCKAHISMRYPIIEGSTALLFLLVAIQFGPSLQTLVAIGITAVLVALTGIDIDHQLLPDDLTLFLLWAGLFASLFNVFTDPVSSIIGAILGYLSLWFVFHMFRLVTGKEGMGYGDFKLLAAMGAWTGWQLLPMIILSSAIVGIIVGVIMKLLKRHKAGQPIPFGPFIASAGWIALLWPDSVVDVYFKFVDTLLRSVGLG